ncbi:hypothetical protein Tco_1422122, partial [Tanacetum coccineum]
SSGSTTFVVDETVHEERGDSMERATTTAISLYAEQGSGDRPAQTRFERLSKQSNDPPLSRVNTLRSGEDRIAPTTIAGVSVSTTKPSTPPLTTTTLIEDEDLTIAQTLMKMRSVKSKEKSKKKGVSSETATRLTRGVIMKEASETATRLTRGVIMKEASETATRPIIPPQQQLDLKDKGKGIMQEPEKLVKVKGKHQIEYDADVAQRLQAELDEEVRL